MISVEDRERAEKGRSAQDAAPPGGSLSMPEETVARYLSPPEDTTHPLEYTFHLLGDVQGKNDTRLRLWRWIEYCDAVAARS